LTEEQMQFGEQVGAPRMTEVQTQPGMFEGTLSEITKGLVRGGIVEPSRFVKENFNLYDPLVFQVVDPRTGEFDPQLRIVSREEKAEIDRAIAAGEMPYAVDFEQLFERGDAAETGPGAAMLGDIAQFMGAYAGVGKLFRIGKGITGGMTQGAAADFFGFGGDEGRITDLLLELGVPDNMVTDFLRTDPNDPDYVGRFKNALEGGVLGGLIEQIGPVYRLIKEGGSRTQLGQAIGDLRARSEQAFSNTISDIIGTGRAVMQGDTEMLGEVFQPAGTPRSLGAAGTGVDDAALAGRTEDFLGQAAIIRPDDVYRGEGTPQITVRQTDQPFVVRGTQQSQIDDMIQSGLVRPKIGGYRKRNQPNSSQIYFGESSEALPTDPLVGIPTETRFVLVGDSDKLAGTEGPIPIDQLRHVWAVRDGETVDILPEILQANREFDNLGAAGADTSYRMQHQPRGPEDDNPVRLDDLTRSTTGEPAGYPEDFYSPVGPRFYAPGPSFPGDDFGRANQESYRAIRAVRGNPDATVTIYRAVPDDPSITTINEGDFVTLSRTYAELHGSSGYGPQGEDAGKILSQEVKVRDIYWDGNDVNEFGYFPTGTNKQAE
jgi:hypothetical protein